MANPINTAYITTDETRIQDLVKRWSIEQLETAIAKIEAMKPHMQESRTNEIRRYRVALEIKTGKK